MIIPTCTLTFLMVNFCLVQEISWIIVLIRNLSWCLCLADGYVMWLLSRYMLSRLYVKIYVLVLVLYMALMASRMAQSLASIIGNPRNLSSI
jgi:hypothetical protein